jgi:non-specific serine/threonine protein kinase
MSQENLTAREEQVLDLLVDGKTNREIAEELGISPRTAQAHVTNLLQKLRFRNRTELAGWWTANKPRRDEG